MGVSQYNLAVGLDLVRIVWQSIICEISIMIGVKELLHLIIVLALDYIIHFCIESFYGRLLIRGEVLII